MELDNISELLVLYHYNANTKFKLSPQTSYVTRLSSSNVTVKAKIRNLNFIYK